MDIQVKTNEELQQELLELRQEIKSLKTSNDTKFNSQEYMTGEMGTRFELAMQGGNMAWWEMDVTTGNVTFDKNKVEMLGYTPEKFTHYKDFTALVHPKDYKRIMNAMKGHLDGIYEHYIAEYRILANTGEYIWFYDYGSVVKRDSNGKPLLCTGFVLNISDRKKTELSLITITKALDFTSDAIGISDIQGHHFYQNKTASDLFGYETTEELDAVGGGISRVKNQAIAKQIFSNGLHGKSWSGEIEMVTKSGLVFPAYGRTDAIKDNEGNIIGIIGIASDITERKQTKEIIRKSENMLHEVLDNFPGVVFWKDRQSIYLGCNQSFAIGAGLNNPVEIIGKTDLDMPWGSTEAIKYLKDDFNVMKSGKERLHILETQHQSNGQVVWLDTSKLPLRDSLGKVIGVLGVSNDISSLKMAEQELINTNKELAFQNREKEKRAAELIIANKELVFQNEEKEKRAIELGKVNSELVFLASNLQQVHDKERVNLAREIHDSLAQLLVALKIDLGMFKKKISKANKAINTQEVIAEMELMMNHVDNANKSVRSIINGLRPEQLELLGFVSAAEVHLSTFEQTHHIKCIFENTVLDPIIQPDQALALFRILQESLNNVLKHAMATMVTVQFKNTADKLVLEIRDNGNGFDVNKKGRPDSYGLIGMKERIKLLGGNLNIISKVGEGTKVNIEIDYEI